MSVSIEALHQLVLKLNDPGDYLVIMYLNNYG
jgi:hypothetical protein